MLCHADVTVIGAGPAGLWLSARLAALGFQPLVIDDRKSVGDQKVCTGIVGTEAFERFQLPQRSILTRIQNLQFRSPQGREIEYRHPEALACVVDRTDFDSSLAELARSSGVRFEVGRRVTAARVDRDGVTVQTQPAGEGEPFQVRSRLAVVATGVNFRLHREVGLGEPVEFLNAVQAYVRVKDLDRTVCFVGKRLAPGAFGWIVPIAPGRAKLGLMAEGRSASCFAHLLERVTPWLCEPHEEIRPDFKPIVQAFRGSSIADRVIAVGEAAGQVKTTTGGGIYYGLLGADLAAEVLAEALALGRTGVEFLSRYEQRWKQQLEPELRQGYRFRKTLSRLGDGQIERLFMLAQVDGILPLIRRTVRFDWHAGLLELLARHPLVSAVLNIKSD